MRPLILVAAIAAGACGNRAPDPKPVERTVVWHQVGSWSGHGSRQTESFASDTGTLRVRWEATAAQPSARPTVFRLSARSAVSGRLLQQVVDRNGPGSGLDYVQQEPHVFYMDIESNEVNWRFTIEEAIGYR